MCLLPLSSRVFPSAGQATPCVAAHSTTRALYGKYAGPLYQVKKADGTVKNITVLAAGGVADSAAQDTFCGASACVIQRIFDQVSTQRQRLCMAFPSARTSQLRVIVPSRRWATTSTSPRLVRGQLTCIDPGMILAYLRLPTHTTCWQAGPTARRTRRATRQRRS